MVYRPTKKCTIPAPMKYQAPVQSRASISSDVSRARDVIPKKSAPRGRVKLRPWSAVPVSTPRRIMTALNPKNAALRNDRSDPSMIIRR